MPDPRPVRLLDPGTVEWAESQALYHAVARRSRADTPDTIIVCRPRTPYVCLGYHEVHDEVLDREACARLGLPVIRRLVGGGTTYLDRDQLFYQCVFHHSRVPVRPEALYALMLAAPVATLRRLGLAAELRDLNEIEVGGRRIAGIGGGRVRESCVVVGNLLFDFDHAAMASAWKAPGPAFRALAAAALGECVATIDGLAGPVDRDAARIALIEAFGRALGRPVVPGSPTREETRLARALARRMAAPGWLALHSDRRPAGARRRLKISARVYIHQIEAGSADAAVTGALTVRDGVIAEARLDSPPGREGRAIERGLRGVAFADWQPTLVRLAG